MLVLLCFVFLKKRHPFLFDEFSQLLVIFSDEAQCFDFPSWFMMKSINFRRNLSVLQLPLIQKYGVTWRTGILNSFEGD